ncbi:DUF4368 domain-containing protein [Ruminococcus sp. AF12-5]|nr:DUF4368 domain-containing protein [Ruminococcus sp. AF12-5]
MEKAVLYLRLSKEDQDKLSEGDDSASIKNQRLLLTDYALEHNYQIVDVYSDDNESGLYDDRPDFERMIEDTKLGKFSVIIAKTQSRFSRNMEHIEKYLHHNFPILGIRFIGVADGTDTADVNNKKARQINGLVNEWYCEDLSKNIKSSFRAKMKDGQYLGPSCPYGYIKDPENHNRLIIDQYAADVVREIFKLYLQGCGKGRIGRILSERGILIPSIYKREVLGLNYHNANAKAETKLWSYQTIHQILNNEMYIGNMVQNKSNTISYKDKTTKPTKRSEWIIVQDTHEPIISKEIFDRAKELQKIRTKEVNTEQRYIGIFSGLLYCADCNHTMNRSYNRRGEHFFEGYVCSTYKRHGTKAGCNSHHIKYDVLYRAVLKSIKCEARKILSDNDVDELKKMNIVNERERQIDMSFNDICDRVEKIKKHKHKTYEAYIDELISIDEYKSYTEKYNGELLDLEKQIKVLKEEKKNAYKVDQEYKQWVNTFSEYANVDTLTRAIVVELIERIDVYNDGSIKIHYRFKNPYETSK